MDYKKYIFNDSITGLDYVDYDIYLDHKDEFVNCSNILDLIINSIIVDEINEIDNNLFLLISAITMIIYEHDDIDHNAVMYYKNRIDILYNSMQLEYKQSKENVNIWKYIDITINDLFNRIKCNNSFIVRDLDLDTIFSDDYYLYLSTFWKEIL